MRMSPVGFALERRSRIVAEQPLGSDRAALLFDDDLAGRVRGGEVAGRAGRFLAARALHPRLCLALFLNAPATALERAHAIDMASQHAASISLLASMAGNARPGDRVPKRGPRPSETTGW